MDRFLEQTEADLLRSLSLSSRTDRDEDGRPDASYSAAGYTCENCTRAVEGTTYIEEFGYWGCDDCRAEAEMQLARESAARMPVLQPVTLQVHLPTLPEFHEVA